MDMFGQTIAQTIARTGPLDVVLPAVSHLAPLIAQKARGWEVQPRIVLGEAEKYAAFRSARAALAASGTVTLELALAQVPMVVGYRVSRIEALARFLVTASSIVLPNLILGENAIPELVQEECTPQALSAALVPLVSVGEQRDAQARALLRLDDLMLLQSGDTPSARAARAVLGRVA